MVIVATIYILLIWLVFGKLKLLPWNRTWGSIVATIGLILLLVVLGLLNFYTPSGSISVVARVTEITPNISGRVASIPIKPNEPISKGAPLLEIEKDQFQFEVDRLSAALAEAEFDEKRYVSIVEEARSELAAVQADLDLARIKRADVARLVERKVSPANDLVRAEAEVEVLENKALSAAERLTQAELTAASTIEGRHTTTEQVRAQLQLAQWNLEQTTLYAPSDGIVTGLTLSVGARITPLRSAMPFINTQSILLVGRFSQNGFRSVKPGAEVWLVFNNVPGRIFKTTIEEMIPGTAEGQAPVSGTLPDLRIIGSGRTLGARIVIPDDLPEGVLNIGIAGSATVLAEDAGPIRILAVVLAYLKSWIAYL
jgi:multidrug resistance efflux pump